MPGIEPGGCMNRRIRTRLIVIMLVTILSLYLFAGFPPAQSKMKDSIHLGLALKGGILLVLQVVTDDAVRAETDQAAESVRSVCQRQNIQFRQISRSGIDTFVIAEVDSTHQSQLQNAITPEVMDWDMRT